MYFPKNVSLNIRAFAGHFAVIIAVVVSAVISISAQKVPTANPSATLEQCRNGSPVPGPCTGSAWVTGNVGSSNSTWKENDFLPYRMLLDNLVPGADANAGTHVYSLVIGYDVKNSGRHAIDYLATYNTTDAGADPCSGVAGCTGWAQSLGAIGPDVTAVTSQINPNTNLPVVQLGGQNFTLWGGTIRSVNYSAIDGPMTNAQVERQVTITFTAQVANPVLAWSGHVGWSGDWGPGNAAGGITGSPYHMRLIGLDGSGGNQDRSLSAAAVVPSGAVIIRKEVTTFGPPPGTAATYAFPFTATANFGSTSFSLVDDDAGPGVDNIASQSITNFGAANSITVTEGLVSGWSLASLNCTESGIADSTTNLGTRTATIVVQAYEVVVCTFSNTQLQPSAAPSTISGRVVTAEGMGIKGATLTLTDLSTGEVRIAATNSFGYYSFNDVPTDDFYMLTIRHKRYTFADDSRAFTLLDNIADMDFVPNP